MAKIEVMHVSCKRKRPWAQFLSLSELLFVLKYRNTEIAKGWAQFLSLSEDLFVLKYRNIFSAKPTEEITSKNMKIFFFPPEALFVLKSKDIQGVLEEIYFKLL